MLMQNVYIDRNSIRFEKMCNKKSKSGQGDLCVQIQTRGSGIIQNHHLKRDSVLDFMIKHYKKEILQRLGITERELNYLLLAKEV